MKSNTSKSSQNNASKWEIVSLMHATSTKIIFSSLAILLLSYRTYDSGFTMHIYENILNENTSIDGIETTIEESNSYTLPKKAIPANDKVGIDTKNDEKIDQGQLPVTKLDPQQKADFKNRNNKTTINSSSAKTTTIIHYSPSFNSPLVFHEKNKIAVAFAPEVGINMNGMYHSATSNALVNGYHLGGTFNISLSKHFALQPSILYINKGTVSFKTENTNNTDQQTKQSDILHYAQIPLNLVYKTGENTDGRFIVGFGTYVAYLFNIEQKSTDNNTNAGDGYVPGYLLKDEVRIPEPILSRFDIGLNSFIGCEMPNGFYCKAGAEIGFINLQAHSNANFGFSLSTGVFIK